MPPYPRHIHIIAFDIPYPPDYGGVIDIWYKIKALHHLGIQITLHVFLYPNKYPHEEIESYCTHIYYYPRNTLLRHHLSPLPYIVKSRISGALIQNILANPSPVLMEGIHSTHHLTALMKAGIPCYVRMHNIESKYYYYLFTLEKNILKKLFYFTEYKKLTHYEKIVFKSSGILFISPEDKKNFTAPVKSIILYPFHGMEAVDKYESKMQILFHANFAVEENRIAAMQIASLADAIHLPIIIAGKYADTLDIHNSNSHLIVFSNPSHEHMQSLLFSSAIHLLPLPQPTGIKLKLIQAIFAAKYIIVSNEMAQNFPWQSQVLTYQTPGDIPVIIDNIINGNIPAADYTSLHRILCDQENAQKLIDFIFINS